MPYCLICLRRIWPLARRRPVYRRSDWRERPTGYIHARCSGNHFTEALPTTRIIWPDAKD